MITIARGSAGSLRELEESLVSNDNLIGTRY